MNGNRKQISKDWQRQMAEVLRASADGRLSVGKYTREQILRTFDREVAPSAVDLLIWDLEASGELDPFI
jgi:hypothetical protein